MALKGDEVVLVLGTVGGTHQPSGEQELVTVQAIANLGGGGGLTTSVIISSGSTATVGLATFVGFNSASGLPKTINAPAATGSLGIVESADLFGDAYTNPITFVPAGGSVVAGGQNEIYTNSGSARWRDIEVGVWANV